MNPTPFNFALQSAKGNTLELIAFQITKLSNQIPFGEGTLQNATARDLEGTEISLAFMDREPIPSSVVGQGWHYAASTAWAGQQAGKLFGVTVGEYKGVKRIEIKKKADVQWAAPQQGAPQQQRQQPTQAPAYQQPRQEQPAQQQQPRQEAPAPRPSNHQPSAPIAAPSLREWAMKIAHVHQVAFDAAVSIAFAERHRHGTVRPQEGVCSLATTIYIELIRRGDWSSIPTNHPLSETKPPLNPLCSLYHTQGAQAGEPEQEGGKW